MTNPEFNVYHTLQRVETFLIPRAAAFPAGSQGAKDIARVTSLLAQIGVPKQNPGRPASPATAAKAMLFDEVRDDLEAIAETARTIDKQEPGFATPYRLGGDSHREILADAQRILKELGTQTTVDKFLAYSMEPDFVSDLTADLALIDQKDGEQENHQIDAVGETARIAALIREGRALLKSLATSVKNKYRRDPETLAEWANASHIQRTPRRKPEDEKPEPPAPGGQ